MPLLEEFEDFSKKVMCLDTANLTNIQDAKMYRADVINAADWICILVGVLQYKSHI